jgi:hypothetical protein
MTSTVPRIVPLGDQAVHTADGTRFALLHVVSGERHHLGWFELGDDDWRVGLTSAGAVVDAGVAPEEVRGATEDLLGRLRAAMDADEVDVPPPVGPIVNRLRYVVDRRRAVERLEQELREV